MSVLVFGATIGFMAGLSRQIGTTSTLIGLLIALIGSSLAPLLKSGDVTLDPDQRKQTFYAAGLMSVGLFVGLGGAFAARWAEQEYWLPRQQKAYLQLLETLRARGIPLANVSIPMPGPVTEVFTLQVSTPPASGGESKAKARLEALDEMIAALEALQPDQKRNALVVALRQLRDYAKVPAARPADVAPALAKVESLLSDDTSTAARRLRRELEDWEKELRAP